MKEKKQPVRIRHILTSHCEENPSEDMRVLGFDRKELFETLTEGPAEVLGEVISMLDIENQAKVYILTALTWAKTQSNNWEVYQMALSPGKLADDFNQMLLTTPELFFINEVIIYPTEKGYIYRFFKRPIDVLPFYKAWERY